MTASTDETRPAAPHSPPAMLDRPLTKTMLRRLLGAALGWRLLIAVLTPVPGRDGANYLWMAERFAEGRGAEALTEVFPPGLSLALAPFVWLFSFVGLAPFEAAKLGQAVIGTAAIVPIVRMTEVWLGRGGFAALCMLVVAARPTQLVGEISSEPLFGLLVGLGLLDAVHGRAWRSGIWSGLAFWVRPEGLVLAVAVAIVRWRRGGLMAVPTAALGFAGLGAFRAWCGQPFWPEAKWELHEARLFPEGASFGERLLHYAGNLVDLPIVWFEAFGLLGVLAILGAVTKPAADERHGRALLLVTLAGGFAAILTFFARWRFLVAWLPPATVLAVAGLRRFPPQGQVPVVFFVVLTGLLGGLRYTVSHEHRYAERRVAAWVAEDLRPDQLLVTDLTRLRYFAGRRPLEPRPYGPEELLALSRDPNARYLVLGVGKAGLSDPDPATRAVLEGLGEDWQKVGLPEDIAKFASTRGLVVWRKGPQ
jgi:hypothetical protein